MTVDSPTGATHELKTWPEFWDAVADGRKTFEVRKNDRGFNAGDTLVLLKYRPLPGSGSYIGSDGKTRSTSSKAATVVCRVTYVLSGFGIETGYVVLGIERVPGVDALIAEAESRSYGISAGFERAWSEWAQDSVVGLPYFEAKPTKLLNSVESIAARFYEQGHADGRGEPK